MEQDSKGFKRHSEEFQRLLDVIHRLRAPDGCPWDREQTAATLKPFILEEAYEVCDAIDAKDAAMLREELGDLLLQIVLQAEIGSETGAFDMADVAAGITAKLIGRHPHVFGDAKVSGSDEVIANWERIKRTEKTHRKSALDGLPASMPALLAAYSLGKRAGRVGFDWPDAASVRVKVAEELEELDEAMASNSLESLEEEIGDLLHAVASLSRHLGVDPEEALRKSCRKFRDRFGRVEQALETRNLKPQDATMTELEDLWQKTKRAS